MAVEKLLELEALLNEARIDPGSTYSQQIMELARQQIEFAQTETKEASTTQHLQVGKKLKGMAGLSGLLSEISGLGMMGTGLADAIGRFTQQFGGQALGPISVVAGALQNLFELIRVARVKHKAMQKQGSKLAYAAIGLGLMIAGGVALLVAPVALMYIFFAYSVVGMSKAFKQAYINIRNWRNKKALISHHEERIKECDDLLTQLKKEDDELAQIQTQINSYHKKLEEILKIFIEAQKKENVSEEYNAPLRKLKSFAFVEGGDYVTVSKAVKTVAERREAIQKQITEIQNKREILVQEKKQATDIVQAEEEYSDAENYSRQAENTLQKSLAKTKIRIQDVLTYSRLEQKTFRTDEEKRVYSNLSKELEGELTPEISQQAQILTKATDDYIDAREKLDKAQAQAKELDGKLKSRVVDSVANAVIATVTTVGFAVAAFVPVLGAIVGMGILAGMTVVGLAKEGFKRIFQSSKAREAEKNKQTENQINELKKQVDDFLSDTQKNRLILDYLLSNPATKKEEKNQQKAMIDMLESKIKAEEILFNSAMKSLAKNPRFHTAKENEIFDLINHELRNQNLTKEERLALYHVRDDLQKTPITTRVQQIEFMLEKNISQALHDKLIAQKQKLHARQELVDVYEHHLQAQIRKTQETAQKSQLTQALTSLQQAEYRMQINQQLQHAKETVMTIKHNSDISILEKLKTIPQKQISEADKKKETVAVPPQGKIDEIHYNEALVQTLKTVSFFNSHATSKNENMEDDAAEDFHP